MNDSVTGLRNGFFTHYSAVAPAWTQTGIAVLIGLVSFYLWQAMLYRRRYQGFLNLPWVGDASTTDLRSAMEEGTKMYPNSPFILPLRDPTVILPHRVIDEVKSLPSSKASLEANNFRRFFGRYTLMGIKSDEFVNSVKQDLTRHVGNILPEIIEETKYATELVMRDFSSQTITLPVYPTMLQYIALLSGRTLVGLPLSRSEQWIDSSIHYAVESMAAGHQLRSYPTAFRRLLAPLLPNVWRLKQHQKRVRMMLHDILAHEGEVGSNNEHGDTEQQGRLAEWLRRHYNLSGTPATEAALGKDHLLASFAAIHIATNALTQVLLDLAAWQEYQGPLREEISMILGSNGADSITMAGLNKMVKLDSFIKESLRISPPGGVVALMRQTTAPFFPSCGPEIPPGTLFAFANNRFDMSSPPLFEPDQFDGFRFSCLGETKEGETKLQFIAPSSDSLTWGYGSHACPARLFAATELKVVVIYFLIHFDLRIKDGTGRPANSSQDFQIMPDVRAEIEFQRKRLE